MVAGYALNRGKYDRRLVSEKDIKNVFMRFFKKHSKKESTYKYAMLQSIFDCVNNVSTKSCKISFDSLFCRFAEIYWVLVFKHKIPQLVPSINNSETVAEKIIRETASKNKIERNTSYMDLPNNIRYEMTEKMKKKCSRYVFGALYTETDQLFFSFSKEKECIKINPLFEDYIKRHQKSLQEDNYRAWSKFYIDAIVIGDDSSYYQRLLKREFGDNRDFGLTNQDMLIKESINEREKNTMPIGIYNADVAKKAREILRCHPDIGLYLAQISENVGEEKSAVKEVLDNSFWSRKVGSRYYYQDITDEDIINDIIFENEVYEEEYESGFDLEEVDEETLELLKNPELLLKTLKLRRDKKILNDSLENDESKLRSNSITETKTLQKKWEYEEVMVLVGGYFQSKDLSSDGVKEMQIKISDFLRKREEFITGQRVDEIFRDYAGIRMQYGRVKCLDPDSGLTGMHPTRLQKEVFEEYLKNPVLFCSKLKEIYLKYM